MIDLEELYAIDPSLRAHETELKKLLTELERAKPDVKIDPTFVAELRRELLNRPARSSFLERMMTPMKKIPFYAGGVAILLLAVLFGYDLYSDHASVNDAGRLASLGTTGISDAGPSAFGSLAPDTLSASAAAGLGAASGIGAATTGESAPVAPVAPVVGYGGGGKAISSTGSDREYHLFTLSYAGDAFTVSDEDADVYRRVHSDEAASRLGGVMSGQANGILDLSGSGGMRLIGYQMAQLSGERYTFNIDLKGGTASISRDYAGDSSGIARSVTEKDIPSDDALIAKATAFLKQIGIDPNTYGTPTVADQWRLFAKQTSLLNPDIKPWYPQIISVVFPLRVDGKDVSDQSGAPFGLNVQIDVLTDSASGAYNIMSGSYEKSAYAVETDTARITRIAERGGLYGYWMGSSEGGTIRLGTPKRILLSMSRWDAAEGRNEQLYVPALAFPLVDPPTGALSGPQTIIVPLVKDILDMMDDTSVSPPVPMPLLESAPVAEPENASEPLE